MAGNYSRQRDISWPLVDTVIWLLAFTAKKYRARQRKLKSLIRNPEWEHINFIHLHSSQEIDSWRNAVLSTQPAIHGSEKHEERWR